MTPGGFIKLRLNDGDREVYLAVDQIAAFAAYDRYRPNYLCWVTTKDGTRHQVIESADQVAALIVAAQAPVIEEPPTPITVKHGI